MTMNVLYSEKGISPPNGRISSKVRMFWKMANMNEPIQDDERRTEYATHLEGQMRANFYLEYLQREASSCR
jgi:hypothetical protein